MIIETVTEAFVDFLERSNIGTFGKDIFIGRVPPSKYTESNIYWTTVYGGTPVTKLTTGEMVKLYTLYVYYRSNKSEDLEKKMFQLEELLNCRKCVNFNGFELVEMLVNQFPMDTDDDSEDRPTGMIQVNIKIYKKGDS